MSQAVWVGLNVTAASYRLNLSLQNCKGMYKATELNWIRLVGYTSWIELKSNELNTASSFALYSPCNATELAFQFSSVVCTRL